MVDSLGRPCPIGANAEANDCRSRCHNWEKKKDNAGILFEERDVRRNGYDIITQIRRLISRFIHSTYTFCFDLKKKKLIYHTFTIYFLIK